jgi:hypothetical protein
MCMQQKRKDTYRCDEIQAHKLERFDIIYEKRLNAECTRVNDDGVDKMKLVKQPNKEL